MLTDVPSTVSVGYTLRQEMPPSRSRLFESCELHEYGRQSDDGQHRLDLLVGGLAGEVLPRDRRRRNGCQFRVRVDACGRRTRSGSSRFAVPMSGNGVSGGDSTTWLDSATSGRRCSCRLSSRGGFAATRTPEFRGFFARLPSCEQELPDAPCVTPRGASTIRAEQHACQFPTRIENRTAGVALSGCRRDLDHLERAIRARRQVLSALSGSRTIDAGSIAGDRQRITRPGSFASQRDRRHLGSPNQQGRQIPVTIHLQHAGGRTKSVGENHIDRPGRVAHNMPVRNHQPKLFPHVHQSTRTLGHAVGFLGEHADHRRVRSLGRSVWPFPRPLPTTPCVPGSETPGRGAIPRPAGPSIEPARRRGDRGATQRRVRVGSMRPHRHRVARLRRGWGSAVEGRCQRSPHATGVIVISAFGLLRCERSFAATAHELPPLRPATPGQCPETGRVFPAVVTRVFSSVKLAECHAAIRRPPRSSS